jgi:hypothetical protein
MDALDEKILASCRKTPLWPSKLEPSLAHLGGEHGGEQHRIDAVHEQGEPASARNAMAVGQIMAQEGKWRRPRRR